MPLYEYECGACGKRFEVIRKYSDPPLEVCTECGKGPVQRLVSSPAFQFKGTGWYVTDYAKKGDGGTSDGSSKADKTSTEKSQDAKSDAAAAGKGSDKGSETGSDTGTKTEAKSEPAAKTETPAKPAAPPPTTGSKD